jgi:hypothetical protein
MENLQHPAPGSDVSGLFSPGKPIALQWGGGTVMPEAVASPAELPMIPGVYNYCDDWCEYCPVTARCRSFHMRQSIEARVEDSPAPSDDAQEMVTFTKELAKADGLTTPGLDAQLAGDPDGEFSLAPADEPLARQALAYAVASELLLAKLGWRPPKTPLLGSDPAPHHVIMWYHLFLAMKVRRALVGAHRAERGRPCALDDARGSAKIALISIERSRDALRMVAKGEVRTTARQLALMLDLLAAGLEARVPGAREFVRVGLDPAV